MFRWIILIACFLVSGSASAEVVALKSGYTFEGKNLQRTERGIRIDFHGVSVDYDLEEIAMVDGQKLVIITEAPPVVPPVPPVVVNAVDSMAPASEPPPPMPVVSEAERAENRQAVALLALLDRVQGGVDMLIAVHKMSWGNKVALMLISLCLLCFPTVCLQKIARRTGTGPAWLAVVPVGNLFLLCKICGIRYHWLWIFFTLLVPVIGVVCVLGLMAFMCYKVAIVLRWPGWFGLLVMLPILGLIILGMMAFMDAEEDEAR